jgi:hypothetical protein
MCDPLKRGVFRTPSVQSLDRPGTGLLTPSQDVRPLRGSPIYRPVAERFSGGFLIRVNAGSIPARSTKCAKAASVA